MFDTFAPFLSRIVAAGLAAGAGYVSTKIPGLSISPEQQTALTTFIVTATFGVVHKLVDRKVNPTDAAHPDTIAAAK